MKGNKDAGFLLGMLSIGALIALAVYFFVISPAIANATAANEAEANAAAFNETLQIQLEQYKAEAAKLPETLAKIEEIQTQLTPWEDTPLVREAIFEIFAREGLTLTGDSLTNPAGIAPGGVVLEPAAQAVGRTSYVDGLAFQNLYATTFEFEVAGSRDAIIRAMVSIQMHEGRYFLIDGFEFAPDVESGTGSYTARLRVVVFTLLDPTGAIDPGSDSPDLEADDEPEPSPSPSPSVSPSASPSPSATPPAG